MHSQSCCLTYFTCSFFLPSRCCNIEILGGAWYQTSFLIFCMNWSRIKIMMFLFLYRFPFTLLFRFRFLFPFPFLFPIPVSGFSRRPSQSKQVSKCCINFPHELTCQVLTNQSIKIGRRAWSTSYLSEKNQKQMAYNIHIYIYRKPVLRFFRSKVLDTLK